MIVHLVDGTYELFRHFYGQRAYNKGVDKPFGAAAAVLGTILQMISEGATHLGVATDHVVESFRNDLWPYYKTGAGIDPVLFAQFQILEDGLAALGVAVWPMIELEADDALASAATIASADRRVQKVCIWTPDKDLAQCVQKDRVVQIDRRSKSIRDEDAIIKKFGVSPRLIPDFLALVGDSADGYPGIPGIGKVSAAQLLNKYGPIDEFPAAVLKGSLEEAMLYKELATLRTDAALFDSSDDLKWNGPTKTFASFAESIGEPKLAARANALATKIAK